MNGKKWKKGREGPISTGPERGAPHVGGNCLGKKTQASTILVVRYSGKVWGALWTWVARVFRMRRIQMYIRIYLKEE